MKIHWENIFAVAIVGSLIVLLTRWHKPATLPLGMPFRPEGVCLQINIPGILVSGLILVLIAALVKLLISRSK